MSHLLPPLSTFRRPRPEGLVVLPLREHSAADHKVEAMLNAPPYRSGTDELILLLFEWFRSRLNELATQADLKAIHHHINMKLEDIKTQIAASAVASTEAWGELGTKIADLEAKLDQAIADAKNPDITDEAFLANLTTIQTNVQQLAAIVPNPADSNVSTSFAGKRVKR